MGVNTDIIFNLVLSLHFEIWITLSDSVFVIIFLIILWYLFIDLKFLIQDNIL